MHKTVLVGTALAALLTLGVVQQAGAAERPKAVIELFTSQGCNSCPPADAILERLADSGDVVALSYHIDYWDYLGWKDTLGSPAHTERQRGYARSLGSRSIYTPQAVINGRVHTNGANAGNVDGDIAEMSGGAGALSIDVSMTRQGDSVVIETGAAAEGGPAKAHVVLVFFAPETKVPIERGENAGKTIAYRNAVSSVQAAGMWKGKVDRWEIPFSEIEKKGAGGAAVLLQSMKNGVPGPILGAAMLKR